MRKVIFIILLVILTLGTAVGICADDAQIRIGNRKYSIDSREIYFNGVEITDFENLKSGLCRMSNLTHADFGTYLVNVDDCDDLQRSLGNTVLNYGTYVTMYGIDYDTSVTVLDMSDAKISDSADLLKGIGYFTNAETVSTGKNAVNAEDVALLRKNYPRIRFNITSAYDLYGVRVREDAESIDLSTAEITDLAPLSDAMKFFPMAKTVTLGENALPTESVAGLCDLYPDIVFEIVQVYDVGGVSVRSDAAEITLDGITADSGIIDTLKCCSKLKTVNMHGAEMDIYDIAEMFEAFPDIDFNMDFNVAGTTVDTESEEVDFTDNYAVPEYFEVFKRTLGKFRNVKKVDFSNCGIEDETLAEMREEFPEIKIVWRIHMGRWSLKTDQVAFSVLIYTYDYRPLTTDDIQVLKYCTDLQALDLGHQWINDISVIGDYLKDLRILILADNNLGDLSPLANLPHLHYLEFFVNHVTDLTPLASCKQLVDLNISYNHGLGDITPLLDLPCLERLWLESTVVPESDVELLRETYPDATIINYGSGSIDQGWRTHDRYFAMIDMFMNNQYTMSEEFSKYD